MPGTSRPRIPRARRILSFLLAPVWIAAGAAGLVSCGTAPEIHERTDFVMGTLAQLKVGAADAARADAGLARALAEIRRIETLATVQADSSELMRLNRAAGGEGIPVTEDLDRILALSGVVATESNGAFDPTAGVLVEAWGFPDHPALPDSAALRRALLLVGGAASIVPEDEVSGGAEGAGSARAKEWTGGRRWRLLRAGMRLDLGGIAKGYAVDRAADRLAPAGGGCLVNVGGDLAVRGSRPDGRGWLIGVQDPRDPDRLFLRLRLEGEVAVATSGDYQRYFEVDGVRYHHILDPRTGWPARRLRSVTVIAPTCALADAWATAAFVLGPEEGRARLEAHPDLEGILVEEGPGGELVIHETSGFAAYVEDRA